MAWGYDIMRRKRDDVVASKKWKGFQSRLRHCLWCGTRFPSTSPANRKCPLCDKREGDARARAYDNRDEGDDFFSMDLILRQRSEQEWARKRAVERAEFVRKRLLEKAQQKDSPSL